MLCFYKFNNIGYYSFKNNLDLKISVEVFFTTGTNFLGYSSNLGTYITKKTLLAAKLKVHESKSLNLILKRM